MAKLRKKPRRNNTEKHFPLDIGRAAHVKKNTRIRVLEYDLPKCPTFLFFGNQWNNLFRDWLNKGAKIEVYAQKPSRETLKMLKRLEKETPLSFSTYLFGDIKEEKLKSQLVNQHFTLFTTPRKMGGDERQLWTELNHSPRESYMTGCSYHCQKGFRVSRREEDWEKSFRNYSKILDLILGKKKVEKQKSVRVIGKKRIR